jgi:DNA-binding CsgD family transcriptional regulator
LQQRIIEMLRQGVQIDSNDPGTVTISKSLGKSEKTIRNHRDMAFSRIRMLITRGEK